MPTAVSSAGARSNARARHRLAGRELTGRELLAGRALTRRALA
ncbi:hypothetical protein OG357_20345 [Streptomyces sp. NBC_01255]|nr:hypothetical protein [Streptomyces sp. NBC_01255]